MIIVGLTGNYGSGKSTVAAMFGELGAKVIDTDAIVRRLLEDPAVIEEIKESFGEESVSGGAVDKKFLAEWVFRDAHARITLEDILHPLVFREVEKEAADISSVMNTVMIVEATVIFERGYQGRFDKIITVYTSEETAMDRLSKKGISAGEAGRRLKIQLPVEIKMRGSDFVIDNGSDIERTREQVRAIYQELLSEEKKHGNN